MLKDVQLRKDMTKEEVNVLVKGYIELLDDVYGGSDYYHRWKCSCGRELNRAWRVIKRGGYTCKSCYDDSIDLKYKKEIEKNGEYIYERSFREGSVLPNGEIASAIYVKVKHKYCNSSFMARPIRFTKGESSCDICCGSYEKSFAHHIEQELGLNIYDVWDFEKNTVNPYHIDKCSRHKVWIKCLNTEKNKLNGESKKDYHESYETYCYSFVKGIRCSYCHSKKIHPYDSFGYYNFEKVMSWHPDNDISPFKVSLNTNKKYKFVCDKYGYIFKKSLDKISQGSQWCPRCSYSKGEQIIEKWLRFNNIGYIYEKKYKDLLGVGGCYLSYDFFLPKLNVLIEFQGKQHEKYIKGFHHKKESFDKQREHDKRKREYAKNNCIYLLEIWYYDLDKVEGILEKELREKINLVKE